MSEIQETEGGFGPAAGIGWRREALQAARFGLVGVLNTSVDVVLFMLATGLLGWHPVAANVVSYTVGVLCSFTLNGKWTFADADRSMQGKRFARFLSVNLATLIVGSAVISLVILVAPAIVAKAMAVVLGFAMNYLLTRRYVFAAQLR